MKNERYSANVTTAATTRYKNPQISKFTGKETKVMSVTRVQE
jgi:hypothetical protein